MKRTFVYSVSVETIKQSDTSFDLSWEHNGQLKVFAELHMSMNDHESEGVSIWG